MSVPKSSKLFEPIKVGRMTLSHRLVMSPMTRLRNADSHVPLSFVKDYYAQRACVPGTLVITEATMISERAGGYANAPGIWSKEQIAAWKEVTDAVHKQGSFIYSQLWAIGRVAMPHVLARDGHDLVSSSAVAVPAHEYNPNPETPRALTDDEIRAIIPEFAQAARNAIEAGFDGVEIHGANGYLVDQFIQDVVNQRTDAWGGSIERRSRFALDVTKAVVDAIGADRVGMRLSPFSTFQGMGMADPKPQFTHVIKGLKALGIAYVHAIEPRSQGMAEIETAETLDFAVDAWTEGGQSGPFFLAGGFKPDLAHRAVEQQYAKRDVCVVFGRSWISTPDLVFRIKNGIDLQKYDRNTFYATSSDGYVDYPFSPEWASQSNSASA